MSLLDPARKFLLKLQSISRHAYSNLQRIAYTTINWLFPSRKNIVARALNEQIKLESTYAFNAYVLAKYLFKLRFLPWDVLLQSVGRDLLIWTSFLVIGFRLSPPFKFVVQSLLTVIRVMEDMQVALLGLIGLAIVNLPMRRYFSTQFTDEIRALIYLIFRESLIVRDMYLNLLIIQKYEAKLGISAYELCANYHQYFIIIPNTMHPCLMQTILFAESHGSRYQHDVQSLLIAILSLKSPRRNVIVFESSPSLQIYDCRENSNLELPPGPDESSIVPLHYTAEIADSATCTGWEDMELAFRLKKETDSVIKVWKVLPELDEQDATLIRFYNATTDTNFLKKQILIHELHQKCLEKFVPFELPARVSDLITNVCATHAKVFEADHSFVNPQKIIVETKRLIFAFQSQLTQERIVDRNTVAITTYQKLSASTKYLTQFWFFGRRHLIPDAAWQSADISRVLPNDDQYPLRHALEEGSRYYCILDFRKK